MAEALERPLLLPKGMDALKHMRQLKLFLSLKKDITMVSSSALFINSDSLSFLFCFLFLFFFFFFLNLLFCYLYAGYPEGRHGRGQEWVKDARNEAGVEANLRTENYRAFGAAK